MTKLDAIIYQKLKERGLVADERLAQAQAATETGAGLAEELVKKGFIAESAILPVIAEALAVPLVELKNLQLDKSVAEKIPYKVASYYRFLPIRINDRILGFAVTYPLDTKTQDEIRAQLGFDLDPVLMSSADIAEGTRIIYGGAAETVEKMVIQEAGKGRRQAAQASVEDIEKLAEDASIIRLVNQIILEAYRKRATDIHIEPYRNGVSIRYRVDGILYESPVPAEIKQFVNAVISRIKIMSNLNIVERRLPQDGRAVVKAGSQVLDLRISTIPTQFGESVVIRILPTQMLFNLQKLGLARKDLTLFESLIEKPHGIIFVTGPTGSGKTTTLYAALSKINTRDRKIITIEDPIEYEMTGITQIQVQPEIGLDFARGLRSILRHDPDVIMVGEVRDLETAEIAIRVALTGHLVFSTLHTNDAASGITRLVDIGVEPYLVASSVEAFIAQRLIRVICPECKTEDANAPWELKRMIAAELRLPSVDAVKLFRGKGCASCNYTGFFGRTAIYEIIVVDEQIKEMILKKASSGQIKRLALARGMRTLAQDGWTKAIAGVTTPEEVMRVTSAEEKKDSGSTQGEAFAEAQASEPLLQPSGGERRSFFRLDGSINVRFKVFRSKDELVSRGIRPEEFSVTKNISAGGLLFIAAEALEVGAIMDLFVDLPYSGQTVQCMAKVIRVEDLGSKYDIAVCFLDLTGAQRQLLERYIKAEAA